MVKNSLSSKVLLFTLLFACGFTFFSTTNVFADDVNQGAIEIPDDNTGSVQTINLEEAETESAANATDGTETDETNNTEAIDIDAINNGRNIDDPESEREVNIDDNSSQINTEMGEEDIEEPSAWPMIISLCALGVVIVAIIMLNLFGRRKK